MPYIKLEDNCKMYYEIHGKPTGKTIILLHGFLTSSSSFIEQIPALVEEGYRVIAIDGIGHGKSDKIRKIESYSRERLLKDFFTIFNSLKLHNTPICLIGNSAGGGIAQIIYHAYKKNIKALILISSIYSMIDRLDRKLLWSIFANILPLLIRSGFTSYLRYLLRLSTPLVAFFMNKERYKVKRWIEDICVVPDSIIEEELRKIRGYDFKDKLKEIKVPTLIICGELDFITPASFAKCMHKEIVNSHLIIIKGAGHLAIVTRAAEINAHIISFLRKYF